MFCGIEEGFSLTIPMTTGVLTYFYPCLCYRQQRGYGREGLFCREVGADSGVCHGARGTDEGDSTGVVPFVSVLKQCHSRMLEATWGMRCKSLLFNAPLLYLVFACLLYCVFDEVLINIYYIVNATCQTLGMQWRWLVNKIMSIMLENNGPLHSKWHE